MQQVIRLTENDIKRLVMEASAKILNPNYSWQTFDQDAFDAKGLEKQRQNDASWYALNGDILDPPPYDANDNIRHNGLNGYYGLVSQGYDSIHRQEATPTQIMFGQSMRPTVTDSVFANREHWFAAPNDEDFGDGMPPIHGNDFYSGRFATRSSFDGDYTSTLDESISRAIKNTIKKYIK